MAPKAATSSGGKQYDEVVVIVLLMALKSSGGSGSPWYKDMAALDGTRSVSGFEHSLRAANKLANELLEKKQQGTTLKPELLGRATANVEATTTPKRKHATGTDDGNTDATPKKKKTPSKKTANKAVDSAHEDDYGSFTMPETEEDVA